MAAFLGWFDPFLSTAYAHTVIGYATSFVLGTLIGLGSGLI
jgi:hypothetical protein